MLLSLTSQFWDLTLDKSKLIRSEHEKFFSGLISLNQHQKHQYKTEHIFLFFFQSICQVPYIQQVDKFTSKQRDIALLSHLFCLDILTYLRVVEQYIYLLTLSARKFLYKGLSSCDVLDKSSPEIEIPGLVYC